MIGVLCIGRIRACSLIRARRAVRVTLVGQVLGARTELPVFVQRIADPRIEQRVFRLPASHKRSLLAHLITAGAWEQVLVFTRTKHGANRLAEYLDKHGLPAVAIHGNKSQNARTKALADFKAGKVRILVATDIAARGLDIDQLPHVVNFELPNIEEDYVHRIGRTGRAGRSGEAISLVAPDEEKLLKGIERMTKQKIGDGDLLGFDASTVEAERPEVREPQKPRQPRGAKPEGERHGGGRKDKGKDSGRDNNRSKPQGGRSQQPRGASSSRAAAPAVPALPPDRAPDEFRDDEIDNFGNRADYVSPNQNKQQNRGRRPGAPAAPSGPSASNGVGLGARPAKPPRSNGGGANAGGQGRRQGTGSGGQGGQGRNGSGRARPPRDTRTTSLNRDELPRQEAAVKSPRDKQPVIVHKGSRLDRFPTPEQLDELASARPRGEKPALLTRNREES